MFTAPFSFLVPPAAGSWTPASLSNLYDWWTPSAGVSLSGSNVLTWTGYNGTVLSPVTATNYATYSASDADWNNQPSVLINPSNAGGEWGYRNTSLTTSVSNKTIIGVGKMITIRQETSFTLINDTPSNSRIATIWRTEGLHGYSDGLPSQTYNTLGITDSDGSYIFSLNEYYVDGSAIKWYASNTSTLGSVKLTKTSVTSNFDGFDAINLGGYQPVAALGCSRFSVVELIYVEGILSAGELSNLENYLNTKYGI